jgi:3-oxoacyl-(acyl-carrier-protein) synthase
MTGSNHSDRRVVITGMGVVSAAGVGVGPLWDAMLEATSFERLMPEFDRFRMSASIFGPVADFDPLKAGLPADFVERNDRYAWFGLTAAREALAQSKLLDSPYDHDRVGVNLGTAIAGAGAMEQGFLAVTGGGGSPVDPRDPPPHLYQYMCPSTLAVEVAAMNGFRGPCMSTVTGCAAGVDCVGSAWMTIRAGEADAMVAGAADAPLIPMAVSSFDAIHALSPKGPELVGRASTPYSDDRNGFILSEGAGVMVVEELGHALRRGAVILAEIVGFASTSNAFHMTGLPADGADLSRAVDLALAGAGMQPSDLHYISAHGSSTRQNDRNETAAFHRSFGAAAASIPISSMKSMLGHPLGAASTIELTAGVLAIQNSYIPPTINYQTPAADCDLDYVPNEGRHVKVDTVLKDAASFSGLHSVMVLKKYSDSVAIEHGE